MPRSEEVGDDTVAAAVMMAASAIAGSTSGTVDVPSLVVVGYGIFHLYGHCRNVGWRMEDGGECCCLACYRRRKR